jgi:pilus assembly protein CpaE
MPGFPKVPGAHGAGGLSIALIGPDEQRRKAISGVLAECHGVATREFPAYPDGLDKLPQMLEEHYDVVIVDITSDPQLALGIVENISNEGSRTVMVFSAKADRELVIQSMRAGAREFFVLPVPIADMADALSRVTVLHPGSRSGKRQAGHLSVFLGAKGGCGVTTIASNFAVSLARESGKKTLLIDLGLPLGDVAIHLGIVDEFSTANALQDPSRLDANFLSSLLAEHSSGLHVLPAPRELPSFRVTIDAVDKLLAVARQSFEYVVVDAGSRLDLMGSALFSVFSTVYLVTLVGISELRNSNRLITRYFASRGRKLQIVLNRHASPRIPLFDEQHITKALTRAAQWKIPDDFDSAQLARNTSTPLAMEDSPIAIAIRAMARKACGLPEKHEKKKGFSLFRRRAR